LITNETELTGDDAAETLKVTRIGPYQLLTQLGSGAMGRVFLGQDGSGRQAAVKVVRSDLAEVPAFRKRFARELDVARRVHSPHIAEIYDAQPDGLRPWLATEYVPGPTLQEAVEQGGGFDSARLRTLASAIAEALKVIHSADVVHRDLKPANVLLGPDGPRVIDFGVARAIDASLLTSIGQTLGTPAYMSPEQANGRSVESPSDIFALGSLLVFAATGRLTFGDGPPLAILHRVVNNKPDLEGVAEDDAELRNLIEECLAKDPDDRPTSERIIEAFGSAEWEPLTSVAWQRPPLGVGLPLTFNDAADAPTAAIGPKDRQGKRIAVISAATVAALVLATIAIVEGSTGNDHPTTKGSSRVGDPLSGANPGAGSFPSGSESSIGATSSGQTVSSGSSFSPSSGSTASPENPGGAPASASGSSTAIVVDQNSSYQTSRGNSSSAPSTSKPSAPVSKTTSKPAPSTTSSATPPQPAHNPPAPMGANEISVRIPPWFGMATVNVTWTAHSDATSYVLHYTISNGTDENVPVNGTAYSYTMPAGSTSCVQVRTVNQYGQAAWSDPKLCFDSAGHQISG